MKQLEISPLSFSSCAFTGHRELQEGFSFKALENAIDEALERGARTFYNGLAVGFDLLAAKILLSKKSKYPDIRLIGCIPFPTQSKYFTPAEKKKYETILQACDETVVFAEHYTKDCYFERNRYMCEQADCLIAYLLKNSGGTAYTVKYFKKIKKGIILFL